MKNEGNYISLCDERIIKLFREGDQQAVDFLMEKYKNLVRQKARTLFLIGGDNDDLIQEGMIGLYKAIRDFDNGKESSFSTFASLCITRQMYSAIKASNRKKNIPLNTYISLDTPIVSEYAGADENKNLVDVMSSLNEQNPEEMMIDKERTRMIEYELEKRLSKFEKEVIHLYLNGHKYIQIAQVLNKTPKSVDNALQRIKTKLNHLLND